MPDDGPVRIISRDTVALILAIGLASALNLITMGVLLMAAKSEPAGLSENATQILTGWGGGIIGILGAVFGYRAGAQQTADRATDQAAGEAEG